jgi:5-formyltetrahydrofolate cyclo-ligase
MQLVKLQVFNDEKVIRELNFKSGINFITSLSHNGNHVGKSTVLRVINFCLGSDAHNIWKDPDTKKTTKEIYDFVTSGRVSFVLTMQFGIKQVVIKRVISLKKGKKVQVKVNSWINDSKYDSHTSFRNALPVLFGINPDEAQYGAIKNRFVRLDKGTANKAYRYFNNNSGDANYISYYSYLFNFQDYHLVVDVNDKATEQKNKQDRIKALLNGKKESGFNEKIAVIQQDIKALQEKEADFDFKDSQNQHVRALKLVREQIAALSSTIGTLDVRVNYAHRTIASYDSKKTEIDLQQIQSLYQEVTSLIPNLTKTLDDVIDFHNRNLFGKSEFVKAQLQGYEQEISHVQVDLNRLLDREKSLIKLISSESHLGGFILIERELQEKNEVLGQLSWVVKEVAQENKEIKELQDKINKLRATYAESLETLKLSINTFNELFNDFTKRIFNNICLSMHVSTDSNTNELVFSILNEDKVAGDGEPRAEALALDMAFVGYMKQTNRKLPHFTLQDYLESIDEDKVAVLSRLANEKNIQVVAAILKDKLSGLSEDFIQENLLLSLTQDDKFFNI